MHEPAGMSFAERCADLPQKMDDSLRGQRAVSSTISAKVRPGKYSIT